MHPKKLSFFFLILLFYGGGSKANNIPLNISPDEKIDTSGRSVLDLPQFDFACYTLDLYTSPDLSKRTNASASGLKLLTWFSNYEGIHYQHKSIYRIVDKRYYLSVAIFPFHLFW